MTVQANRTRVSNFKPEVSSALDQVINAHPLQASERLGIRSDDAWSSQMRNERGNSPTTQPAEGLTPALAKNIDAIMQRRRENKRAASRQERAAELISRFAGSMLFVYIHLVFYGVWIVINLAWIPSIVPWDPSLVILAMEASVEAIFLSTFVLINQNRMAAEDDTRADLDLQVSLLNEHETTRLISMVEAIARKLEIATEADAEVDELKRDVAPVAVLDRIEETNKE